MMSGRRLGETAAESDVSSRALLSVDRVRDGRNCAGGSKPHRAASRGGKPSRSAWMGSQGVAAPAMDERGGCLDTGGPRMA